MHNVKLVVDSSANLTELSGVSFACAPLKIVTSEKQYIDTKALDVHGMVKELYSYSGKSSTSCPNTSDWMSAFGDAEEIICFTITSALSGSYNSACTAKQLYEDMHPGRRVLIIDSLSAGPEIAMMAERAAEMISDGLGLDEIGKGLYEYKTELVFVLESMKNLANNGRISKLAAAAAGILGVRAVGRASDEGTLELLSKSRGTSKALADMIGHMKEMGYSGGKVRIAHCLNSKAANQLKGRIEVLYPSADITIEECRGLCSFYAEMGGMLVGFEV